MAIDKCRTKGRLPDKSLHSVVVIMIVTGSCKTFKSILESHTTSVYIIKSKWVTPRSNRSTKSPNINGLQHTAEAPNNLDGPSAQPNKTGRSRPMTETRKQRKRHVG
ncbi:hypothetical protein YC2023_040133 [Brassica napus]